MASPFLNISIGSVLRAIILCLLLLPIGMLILWFIAPKRKLVVAIIDKTVLDKKGQEHISLIWVLNQERFTKTNTKPYLTDRDYFGFFPLAKDKFQIKGLERFSNTQLTQLSVDADVTYIADTYGVYKNEWYKQDGKQKRPGMLYGGMSEQDVFFLRQMQAKHKLIIAEFNCLASPTTLRVRKDFENSFGIKWTEWVGRYFDSFDTTLNKELPKWIVTNYKIRHKGTWPFTKSGVAFIRADNTIVILENETHLKKDLPKLIASAEGQNHYKLPLQTTYTFWFDVIEPNTSFNHVVANFVLDVNEAGKKELAAYGLTASFPAITAHINQDYRFFYFSADFADNPIPLSASYFKGSPKFKWLMYNNREPLDRNAFFWKIYQPLVTTILTDYYSAIKPS